MASLEIAEVSSQGLLLTHPLYNQSQIHNFCKVSSKMTKQHKEEQA